MGAKAVGLTAAILGAIVRRRASSGRRRPGLGEQGIGRRQRERRRRLRLRRPGRGPLVRALAADGDPDLLNCGPGEDKAFVIREERSSTHLVGCETLLIVVELTADQEEGENSDADAEAEDC